MEDFIVNHEQRLNNLEKQFGIKDNEKLIEEINEVIKLPQVPTHLKSKGYCLIGLIIEHLAPHLQEDQGSSYYKKALEFDKSNYDALLGICSLFNTYPYPFNTIVTEVEFLSYIDKLVNDFELLNKTQKIIPCKQ